MLIILIIITIFFLVLQSVFLKITRSIGDNTKVSFFKINGTYTGLIAIIFALFSFITKSVTISPPTIYIGIFFGLAFMLTMFFYSMAMDTGPLSYTAFFYSIALVIPVLASILFWGETIDFFKFVGLILLIFSFYLINISGGGVGKFKYQWLIYASLTFLFNGIMPTLLKWHEVLLPNKEIFLFLFIGFSISSIFSFILVLFFNFTEKKKSWFSIIKLPFKSWLIIFGIAFSTGIINMLLTFLSGKIPGAYLFPVVNGSLIICLTFISIFFFKEKITKTGVLGISIGVMSIIIINVT